jgi:Flp pilus assembly protein TadB
VVVVILTMPLAALLGLGTGLGLLLVTIGLIGRQDRPLHLEPGLDGHLDAESPEIEVEVGWWARLIAGRHTLDRRRLALCLAFGILVGLISRWPVAALLAGTGAWILPRIIGPDRGHTQRVARIEAIAVWAETLRDSLSGAAGLEQAIAASAIESPQPIREEITRLAVRLRRGWRLRDALRALAAELADPTADLVVAGLLMAAKGSAGQLGEVLGELAVSARKKVAARQRIAAARRSNRTSARVIVCATLAMAIVLTLLNRGYLEPFDTPLGQLVLLTAGACFGLAFGWLARLMRDPDATRILAAVAGPPSPPVVEVRAS